MYGGGGFLLSLLFSVSVWFSRLVSVQTREGEVSFCLDKEKRSVFFCLDEERGGRLLLI